MDKPIWFRNEQLSWFEELPVDYYVEVIVRPRGDGIFPNDTSLYKRIIESKQLVQLRQLTAFKADNAGRNIWRSWLVYRDVKDSNPVGQVPLYFDIDADDKFANLEQAYVVTAHCLRILGVQSQWFGSPNKLRDHLRVVFSGRKGFHIEAKPIKPVDGQEVRDDLLNNLKKLFTSDQYISNHFSGITIDPFHDWIRMPNTVYSWKLENGNIRCRKVFQMHLEEFQNLQVKEILARAELD